MPPARPSNSRYAMAIRGTMDPPRSLPSVCMYLLAVFTTIVAGCSLEFKPVALSQNGNGHLGIPQHHFDPFHASILTMGWLGVVGVDIPSELNTPLQSPAIYHASSVKVGAQCEKIN